MKLAREMQADYEIDDFDVAQVERTAEDRRGFEAVDLAWGWDQALVFGSDGQPGEQVAVLAAGRGEVRLERAGAVPGPGEAALEGIQKPEAVFGLEDHVAEGGGEVNSRVLAPMLIHCHDSSPCANCSGVKDLVSSTG